jgi:hypothetical protein
MREFGENVLLPAYSQSNRIENKQAAMNGMEMTSFHARMYTFSSSLFQPHAILWSQKIVFLAARDTDRLAPFYGVKMSQCITSE